MEKYNTEIFIEKAKDKFGDKYDYSKVNYVNNHTEVTIICPTHGEFQQQPNSHLEGHGCPWCAKVHKKTTPEFIEKARKTHGDKYDYSKTVYINKRTKVLIGCPIHGIFEQLANNHLRGQGCPDCGKRFRNISIYLTSQNGGCPSCNCHESSPENEIAEYISNIIGEENVVKHDRTVINPYEIDIFIPSSSVGIEYNGLWWHSGQYKQDKNYHLLKTEMCKSHGVKLIQIFEDEYLNNKEIVLNKIKHLLNCNENKVKIGARKTTINEISVKDAKLFLDTYHIQGFSSSSVYLGAYYLNELVGVMTFKKETKNGNKWELTRFASNYNYIFSGLGGKLFNYFVKKYNPSEIKSFADRRWTINEDNNLYTKIGFNFIEYTKPDYKYIHNGSCIRQHKFNFRKKILSKKFNLDIKLTEKEMCDILGFYKIWDCGLIKYVWKNN